MTAIAWAYFRYGTLPEVAGVLYGVKPVIIAVVIQALWRLGKTAIKTRLLGAITVTSLAASLADVNELIVLLVAGLVIAIARRVSRASNPIHATGGVVPALTEVAC